MADRFPLIVNESSRKIEEMISGDNLDLTGNGIAIGGSTGVSGQYLKSDGGVVSWDNPGDVYLTATQTLTDKTFENCTLSGTLNTISNIQNSSLVNSNITINGQSVSLGGSVVTPNDNTTYTIEALDGLTASEKIIRIVDSNNVEDDVIFAVSTPASVPSGSNALDLTLSRTGDTISLTGTVVDNNTVTTLQSFTGGTAQTGAMILKGTGGATITQDAPTKTITIDTRNDDTITQLRAGVGGTYSSGNWTILEGSEVTISQSVNGTTGEPELTINSVDTITRVQGGGSGAYQSGDILIEGGTHRDSSVSVLQSGNTIQIDAFNDDTITRLASTANNGTFALASGDFRFTASGDADLTQTTDSNTGLTTIDIGFTNTDTGAGLGAANGIVLSSTDFELKNAGSLTENKLLKWDSANSQLVNSVITDNGTDVTIDGNLSVTGTTTTFESTILQIADPVIELRRGASLIGGDGGIRLNRTTDSNGIVQTWTSIQWDETNQYWRILNNAGTSRRFVTETENQTLTNKELVSPTFSGTTAIGVVTNDSINGLTISTTIGSTLDFADQKTLTLNNSLTFTATDTNGAVSINFGTGHTSGSQVAYLSNNLGQFATTTSVQLRSTISDPTGSGQTVFNTTPSFTTGVNTSSQSFAVFNSNATTINAFGAATDVNIGATTGDTTINHKLIVSGDVELNTDDTNSFIINGLANFENADITIRGTDTNPMTLGRGGGGVSSNTALGVEVLTANQGGSQNVGVGYQALASNVSGLGNVAVGDGALRISDVGNNNVAIGKDASLNLEGGDENVLLGNSAGYGNVQGNDNVCIGAFAGYNMTGSGNVLIGSGRAINSINGPTYSPPSSSGNTQLVIGSSGGDAQGTWISGDNSFNITLPNNLNVGGDVEVTGNLTVNGTTTTLNVQTIQIDDNALELAAVATAPFAGNVTNGSQFVTNVETFTGVIPGMEVNVISGTALPGGTTTILSVDPSIGVIELSNNVSGTSGTASFEAIGPTDLSANGGGLILKGGTTDKTILYDHDRTDKYWVFSENLEIKANRHIAINGTVLLSGTALGTTVTSSSLTSVGTLTGLVVQGETEFNGRVKENTINQFNSTLTPSSGVLTINTATSNTICGTPTASAINTWAFTNVNLAINESITLTLILKGNATAIYGDACTVDGSSITNGIEWSGGSPPLSTTNTDILTFIIVKDSVGTTRVFGQGNTDFS